MTNTLMGYRKSNFQLSSPHYYVRNYGRITVLISISILLLFITAYLFSAHSLAPTHDMVTPAHQELAEELSSQDTLDILYSLPVAYREKNTHYHRDDFGESWSDQGTVEYSGNGCRTREDILQRDLHDTKIARDGCKVLSGTLHDPFTGQIIPFTRGPESSAVVQIDHVVSLSNAYATGARYLSAQELLNFANDPLNLLAVDGAINFEKGNSDASEWLPPNEAFICEYVQRQVLVKARYALWVTPQERTALEHSLKKC